MSKRKIFNIVNICLSVLLIIFMFLPFISVYGSDVNFWDVNGEKHIIPILMIIELLGACVFYIMQVVGYIKETKNAYPFIGFGVTYYLYYFISAADAGSLDVLGYGFWLALICSVALTAMTIIANYMSDEAPVRPQQPYGGGYGYNPNQYGYNGQPQNNGYYPNQQMPGPQQGYNGQNGPMYR